MIKSLPFKSRALPKMATLIACTALGTSLFVPCASAQLSIMGTIDTRPTQHKSQTTSPKRPAARQIIPNKDTLGQSLNNRPSFYQRQTPPPVKVEPQRIIPQAPPPALPAPQAEIPSGQSQRAGFSANEIDFNRNLDVITARGNVEIIHGDQILIADTVSYNQRSDVVTASGNVQIIQPNGEVILSDFIEITSDLRSGTIQKLELVMVDNSLIQAKTATRSQGRFTSAKDATYTPCQKCDDNPERPVIWNLEAKEVLHDQNLQRIEYYDVFLNVYDVPVFYLPYFHHPDPSRKRESGILVPSYGSQGDLGTFLTVPYFFNISPHQDLTLTPTYYFEEDQPHLLAEYRQHTPNGKIDFEGSITHANGGNGATDPNEEDLRSHIVGSALFNIDRTWRWGVNINAASDDTYHRKYGITREDENGYLVSDIFREGFRGRNYFNTNLTGYQDLRDSGNETVQNGKAEVLYSYVGTPQKTGAFWSSDVILHGINDNTNSRKARLSADSTWELPYTSPTGDIYTLKGNLVSAGYFTSNYHRGSVDPDYTGFQGRLVPSALLSWQKPLARAHADGLVNEVFEPIVQVKVAPNVGDNDRIPNEDSQDFEFDDTNLFSNNRFTGIDKIDGGQRVDYGFNWGFYGASGGYSQVFVGQSYRLRDDDTYDTNSGLEDNISDIVGRVEVSPSDFINVLYRYRLDKNDLSLNKSETSLTLGPKSTRFSLSHLYVEGTGNDSEYGTREEIYGSLVNKWSKHWYSEVDARYRMNDPEGNVSQGFEIGYQDECLKVSLDFRKTFSEDRDISPNEVFTIRFELKNLGGFSPL